MGRFSIDPTRRIGTYSDGHDCTACNFFYVLSRSESSVAGGVLAKLRATSRLGAK